MSAPYFAFIYVKCKQEPQQQPACPSEFDLLTTISDPVPEDYDDKPFVPIALA